MNYIDLLELFNGMDKKVLDIKLRTYTEDVRNCAKKYKYFNT